jgi:hypothetical protein
MAEHVGLTHGAKLSVAEVLVAVHGDFLLSLGYAALFFPALTMSNGVPLARFSTTSHEQPIDCVHVDLLHHNAAAGRTPDMYAALGHVLATAWTQALAKHNLPGRFLYDTSSGFDVVYEP